MVDLFRREMVPGWRVEGLQFLWPSAGVVNLLAPSPLCLHPGRLPGYYHHHVVVEVVVLVVVVVVVENGFMRGRWTCSGGRGCLGGGLAVSLAFFSSLGPWVSQHHGVGEEGRRRGGG